MLYKLNYESDIYDGCYTNIPENKYIKTYYPNYFYCTVFCITNIFLD